MVHAEEDRRRNRSKERRGRKMKAEEKEVRRGEGRKKRRV